MRPLKIVIARARKGMPKEYSLTVPAYMAELVPDDVRFVPEFTKEGILFRRVDQVLPPSWAGGTGHYVTAEPDRTAYYERVFQEMNRKVSTAEQKLEEARTEVRDEIRNLQRSYEAKLRLVEDERDEWKKRAQNG